MTVKSGNADIEGLKALGRVFLAEFLPEGARSGHSVLFDFDGKIDHSPDADELARALAAYRILVEKSFAQGPQAVRFQLSSSELMLGLLGRAMETGLKPAKGPTTERLVELLHEVLEAAEAEWDGSIRADGFKRLVGIAGLIEQNAVD